MPTTASRSRRAVVGTAFREVLDGREFSPFSENDSAERVIGMEDDEGPICYINGQRFSLPLGRAETTLLSFLREKGFTGSKLGCGEGGCGACTVMLSSWDPFSQKLIHRSINACLCPLYAVEGMHVITVEGIGGIRKGLHPVQERIAKAHGSQCGACTPGFVMSMYSLLRSKNGDPISEEEIEENLAGNLCRCTGYRPILDAFRIFATQDSTAYTEEAIRAAVQSRKQPDCDGGVGHPNAVKNMHKSQICPSTGRPCDCGMSRNDVKPCVTESRSTKPEGRLRSVGRYYAEPIFPPELQCRPAKELLLPGRVASWYRPLTFEKLLQLKRKHYDAKVVCGNTEVGIEMRFKAASYPVLISPSHIPELNQVTVAEHGVTFGSAVTLTCLLQTCQELCKSLPSYRTSILKAIAEQLRWFAGPAIRNAASIGGNVCTASPISDLNPLWIAGNATFEICSIDVYDDQSNAVKHMNGEPGIARRSVTAASFFRGYRKVDLEPFEVLSTIYLPFTEHFEYVKEFKQAKRRDDDIAIVNAGIRLRFKPVQCTNSTSDDSEENGRAAIPHLTSVANGREALNDTGENPAMVWVVSDATLCFGGVAAMTLQAHRAAAAIIGKPINSTTLQEALKALKEDIIIDKNAPGGMVEFRNALAASFVFKVMVYAAMMLEEDVKLQGSALRYVFPWQDVDRSAAKLYCRPPTHGIQYFEKSQDGAIVGASHRHTAADMQASGEAIYVDDMPSPPGTLHGALILSERPHARILHIDVSDALGVDGVVHVFTARDIPGGNDIGAVIHDEELFASDIVTCVGQCIGIVVGETEYAARRGVLNVKVTYEDLPAILDIDDAIDAKSFYEGWGHELSTGNVEDVFSRQHITDENGNDCMLHVYESDVRIGGQEHFYLEPNAHLVIPGEGNEIVSFSSTQCPDKHQRYIAHVLGIPQHKVVVRTKRLGGGFGGKETRAAWANAAAAIPAYILNRPVRLTLDRDVDMATTGQRHPFFAKYRVGCDSDGKIYAFDVCLYSNGGNSLDLSSSVMDRALMHVDNVYRIHSIRARGFICRTNLPSNTAFRGFGGPQGMHVTEHAIDLVARNLGKSPEEIRTLNMYDDGDLALCKQILDGCQAKPCWKELMALTGSLEERRREILNFNSENRFRKRGMAVVPTKFGISFTTKFLNQAGALVHVYHEDGSVLVTHGGVEMGQGLHTKVSQVVAQALGVPMDAIHISETSTDKVPNASPTAASASSDMYGAAAADACAQINERLQPFKTKMRNASFQEIVKAAYLERVDLSAHGFYATPSITGFGGDRPFNYLTYGAAATEIEIDVLTGDWHILRSDIVMDVGKSLNPAIDIGQIEGAFVQGMGWACIEELVWGDRHHPWVRPGWLHTRGPGAYKLPTANDIPLDFRVMLLRNSPCMQTPMVHSSKAVGEPPFFLGTSVFWALKDAIYEARRGAGTASWFQLDLPSSPERLRMAVCDAIAREFVSEEFRAKLSA